MGTRTGAEKYLAGRMKSASYADAYRRARARIAFVDELMQSLDDERRARSLSKAELARRAGLKPEAVRRLFSQSPVNPTLSTLCALADALDVEVRVVRPRRPPRRGAPKKAAKKVARKARSAAA
jgi:DNA-binding phage protein